MKQKETPAQFDRRKNEIRFQWEIYGDLKLGLGNQYILPMNKSQPKPIKFDGVHIKNLLKNDTWKEAIHLLDDNVQTIEVWEVTNHFPFKVSGIYSSTRNGQQKKVNERRSCHLP